MAWNHRHSTELWIGYREKPNETLVEGPALQDASTASYATLPAGHPLGYHDAVLNLFRDFYNVVGRSGKTSPVSRPTFETGYEEMKILDSIVRSNKKRRWVKVTWD